MFKEIQDQLLHFLLQLVFFLPLAIWGTPLSFWWATHWFLVREFFDQRAPGSRWPIFPIGSGKALDLTVFELGSLTLTKIYILFTHGSMTNYIGG